MKRKTIFSILGALILTVLLATNVSKVKAETKMKLNASTTMLAAGSAAVMRRMEQEANQELSNYDDDDYDDYDEYENDDDFLDFAGEHRNLLSAVEGHNYTFVIVNAKAGALDFYLNPSQKYKTKDGALSKGSLTDGTFAAINDAGSDTSLTCTSDQYGSVDFLRRFIENNPTYVKAFQIQSSTAAGIQQCKITVEEVSPFRQLPARTLKPTMYQDQNMFNDKVINIPAGFDLNDQCSVKMTIAASTTLTVTIVCGAVLNGAGALRNKRTKARNKRK